MAQIIDLVTGRLMTLLGKFKATDVEGVAPAVHTHSIASLTGVAPTVHTHVQSEISGLVAALAAKAASAHTHVIADLPVASEVEAKAGLSTAKVVTPERLRQGANEAIRLYSDVQEIKAMVLGGSYQVGQGKRVVWCQSAEYSGISIPDPWDRPGQSLIIHSRADSVSWVEVLGGATLGDGGFATVHLYARQTVELYSDGAFWIIVGFYERQDQSSGVLVNGVREKLINFTANQNLSDNEVTRVLTGSTERTLTLLDGWVDGRRVQVKNAATAFCNLYGKLESTSLVTIGLAPGEAMTMQWSTVSGCWRILGDYRPLAQRFSVLTADVVNNNASANTLADLTGLGFMVQPGTYRFKFVIPYNAAVTTTGSRWTINGPTLVSAAYRSTCALTATTETINQGLTAYQQPAAANATSLTTGNVAIIEGIIEVGASGTILPQFASEVSNSAITALKGATGELVRVQ